MSFSKILYQLLNKGNCSDMAEKLCTVYLSASCKMSFECSKNSSFKYQLHMYFKHQNKQNFSCLQYFLSSAAINLCKQVGPRSGRS